LPGDFARKTMRFDELIYSHNIVIIFRLYARKTVNVILHSSFFILVIFVFMLSKICGTSSLSNVEGGKGKATQTGLTAKMLWRYNC